MTCQHCQGKHPTILHTEKRAENKQNANNTDQRKRMVIGTRALVGKEDDNGPGKDCKLSKVPVQVKMTKGNKTIITYAFLDPGSTATFYTENLIKQLNSPGQKTKAILQTMGQNKPVTCFEITRLQVGSLDGNNFY